MAIQRIVEPASTMKLTARSIAWSRAKRRANSRSFSNAIVAKHTGTSTDRADGALPNGGEFSLSDHP